MNKKGGLLDLIVFMILIFILVVILVVFMYAQNTVHHKLLDLAPSMQNSFSNDTNVTNIINDTVGKTTIAFQSFTWISVFLIFGYLASLILTSFLVKSHPVFFVAYIFVVIISVIVAVYISNVYQYLMVNDILGGTWVNFIGANYIFTYLPIWISIIGFVSAILMYINMVND